MTVYEMIQELAQFPQDARVIVEVTGEQVSVYNPKTDSDIYVDFEKSSIVLDVVTNRKGEAVIGVDIWCFIVCVLVVDPTLIQERDVSV